MRNTKLRIQTNSINLTPKQYKDYLISELEKLEVTDIFIDELYSYNTQKEILKQNIKKQVAIFIIDEIKKAVSGQEIEWYEAVKKELSK